MGKAKLIVYKDRAGQWRWRLKAPNGRTIADSGEGYWNKRSGVLRGFRAVQRWALEAEIKVEG